MDCALLADCEQCTSNQCFWSEAERRCGKERAIGYSTACTAQAVAKFSAGVNYKNKNIQSSDGKVGYVTSTGIVKPYASSEVQSGTTGKRGCPTAVEPVNQLWDKLGFALGSGMAKGQACGNEASYIAAAPPENSFDAAWYRAKYDLKGDTDAYSDWVDHGAQLGRLPNESILSSMQHLGKVGYVDADAVLHTIEEVSAPTFRAFPKRSNVTGASMQDCTSRPAVTYGTSFKLTIVDDQREVGLRDGTATVLGAPRAGKKLLKLTELRVFVRPVDTSVRDGTPVRFGDRVFLASTSSTFSDTCGLWGCNVANVERGGALSGMLRFKSNGSSADNFTVTPTSTSNAAGDKLEVGASFTLTAMMSEPNSFFKRLVVGDSVDSGNGLYSFTYRTDGRAAIYRSDVETWVSPVGSNAPGLCSVSSTGRLELRDASKKIYWQSENPPLNPAAPCVAVLQNNGVLALYKSVGVQSYETSPLWTAGAADASSAANIHYQLVRRTVSGGEALVFVPPQMVGKVGFTHAAVALTSGNAAPPPGCNLQELQEACAKDKECAGFIHDAPSNTSQQIRPGAEYKIGAAPQDFYVKAKTVDLVATDTLCPPPGKPTFVDAATFGAYPQGTPFSFKDATQCTPSAIDAFPLKKGMVIAEAFTPNNTLAKLHDDAEILSLQARVRAAMWIVFALGFVGLAALTAMNPGAYYAATMAYAAAGAAFLLWYGAVILYKRRFG